MQYSRIKHSNNILYMHTSWNRHWMKYYYTHNRVITNFNNTKTKTDSLIWFRVESAKGNTIIKDCTCQRNRINEIITLVKTNNTFFFDKNGNKFVVTILCIFFCFFFFRPNLAQSVSFRMAVAVTFGWKIFRYFSIDFQPSCYFAASFHVQCLKYLRRFLRDSKQSTRRYLSNRICTSFFSIASCPALSSFLASKSENQFFRIMFFRGDLSIREVPKKFICQHWSTVGWFPWF